MFECRYGDSKCSIRQKMLSRCFATPYAHRTSDIASHARGSWLHARLRLLRASGSARQRRSASVRGGVLACGEVRPGVF